MHDEDTRHREDELPLQRSCDFLSVAEAEVKMSVPEDTTLSAAWSFSVWEKRKNVSLVLAA